MNISTDGMIAAIRSAAERVEPRESEVLNGIADRIAELVASANKNRRTAKHYERECLEWQGRYSAAEEKLRQPWIKCKDRMPEDDQTVVIVDAGHGCLYGGAVVSWSGSHFYLIGGLSAENYDGGAIVELDMEATHWMPLPEVASTVQEGAA